MNIILFFSYKHPPPPACRGRPTSSSSHPQQQEQLLPWAARWHQKSSQRAAAQEGASEQRHLLDPRYETYLVVDTLTHPRVRRYKQQHYFIFSSPSRRLCRRQLLSGGTPLSPRMRLAPPARTTRIGGVPSGATPDMGAAHFFSRQSPNRRLWESCSSHAERPCTSLTGSVHREPPPRGREADSPSHPQGFVTSRRRAGTPFVRFLGERRLRAMLWPEIQMGQNSEKQPPSLPGSKTLRTRWAGHSDADSVRRAQG